MKAALSIFVTVFVSLAVAADSCAAMAIRQIATVLDYGGIARQAEPAMQFVFCSSCYIPSSPSRYQRELTDVPISITLSAENESSFREVYDVASDPIKEKEDRQAQPVQIQRDVSILFDLNNSQIREDEKNRLAMFLAEAGQQLRTHDNTAVEITGYTCDIGTKPYNDLLAKKRAASVATYLEQKGIHPLHVTGKGKCCYVSTHKRAKYLNRRVEVRLTTRRSY